MADCDGYYISVFVKPFGIDCQVLPLNAKCNDFPVKFATTRQLQHCNPSY